MAQDTEAPLKTIPRRGSLAKPAATPAQVALVTDEQIPEPVSADYLLGRYDQAIISHFLRLQKHCPGRPVGVNLKVALNSARIEVMQSDASVRNEG